MIREVVVENASEHGLSDVRVRIESRPAVVHPLTLRIDRIPAGSNHQSWLSGDAAGAVAGYAITRDS